ncbi:MAG: hypothetical protein Q8R79_06855 [Legionellaceae bacterium]|nr:hypothetical protein [Legionellaceae bacterium]
MLRFERRFDQIDARFDRMEERFDKVDKRFDKVDERLRQVDEKFNILETKLRSEMQSNFHWLIGLMSGLYLIVITTLMGFVGKAYGFF